jgi:hypothetical protein
VIALFANSTQDGRAVTKQPNFDYAYSSAHFTNQGSPTFSGHAFFFKNHTTFEDAPRLDGRG